MLGVALAPGALLAGCATTSSPPSPVAMLKVPIVSAPTIDRSELREASRLDAATYRLARLTFTATWTYSVKHRTTDVTVSQVPGWTRIELSDGAMDLSSTSGTVYVVCPRGARCPGARNDPLFTTRGLVIGTEMGDALEGYTTTLADAPVGVSLRFTHATIAGLRSTCVALLGGRVVSQKLCITASGVITYASYAHRRLMLTSFRRAVLPQVAVVPANATRVTN